MKKLDQIIVTTTKWRLQEQSVVRKNDLANVNEQTLSQEQPK